MSEVSAVSLGEQIRRFRKQVGLSQKELAEMTHVTRNTVINWEAGKYRPDPDLFPVLFFLYKGFMVFGAEVPPADQALQR